MAGGLSCGAVVLLEQPQRVSELTLYCLARAAQAVVSIAQSRGVLGVARQPWCDALLCCAALSSLLSMDPTLLKPSQRALLRLLFVADE
jgi:hypothetical protein